MLNNYPQLRYCKILKGKKAPFEKDWTNKPYKWEEIQEHIKKETNYGVLCGYGSLAVIDADNPELQRHIAGVLPETFRVKTGGGGMHNYFFVPNLKNKIVLITELMDKQVHWGEVQSYGTQVVAPDSLHPNGRKYEVVSPLMIAEISKEELLSAIRPFIKETQEADKTAHWEKKTYGNKTDIDSLNVADIWGTAGLKSRKDEYFGAHPIHGSETGMNFWINPSKNLWTCFRCQSGGGALSAIAVKEGLIDCSEARKGYLRGALVLETIKTAKEKYGLKTKIPIEELKDEIVIWEKDLENYQLEEKEWIVKDLIPSYAIGVWTGKRSTMKTFTSLQLACCVADGIPYLDKFETKKGRVIYLDKENGVYVLKERVPLIKRGLELENNLDIGFICHEDIKISSNVGIKKFEEIIIKYKPSLVIIDTYRRVISFEENDAGAVSQLFVDKLAPLVKKYGFSIILIHHDRKGESQGDEMDMIRGSSDLANYADFILKNKRKGSNRIILEQLKLRARPEIKPQELEIKSNNDHFIKFELLGEYEQATKEDYCAKILTDWIISKKLTSFTTNDASQVAFSKGIKQRNFYNGLTELLNSGLIKKDVRGKYIVNHQLQLK